MAHILISSLLRPGTENTNTRHTDTELTKHIYIRLLQCWVITKVIN